MKIRFISITMTIILFVCAAAMPAFAVGESVGGGVAIDHENSVFKGEQSKTPSSESLLAPPSDKWWEQTIVTPDEILGQNGKTITVDDASNLVNRKMSEVAHLIQVGLRWVCLICFFGCIGLVAVGAFGNKRLMVGGFLGMLICGVAFTIITCGPQVMNAFAGWLQS